MWVILFLIALIPMFFFWTDAAVDLIPQWESALPLNKDSRKIQEGGKPLTLAEQIEADRRAGKPIPWYPAESEKGYAAYLLSQDGQYRLTVGCHFETPPTIHLTHISGSKVASELVIPLTEESELTLTDGYLQGDDVISAVAQMTTIAVMDGAQKVVDFKTDIVPSEGVARSLAQNCKR